jgi:hypothetical protein
MVVGGVGGRGVSFEGYDPAYFSFAVVSATWNSISAIWDSSFEMEVRRLDYINLSVWIRLVVMRL